MTLAGTHPLISLPHGEFAEVGSTSRWTTVLLVHVSFMHSKNRIPGFQNYRNVFLLYGRFMAPYPSVAQLFGGFEIPQAESALAQVFNAIDAVVNLKTKRVQPEVRSGEDGLPHAC